MKKVAIVTGGSRGIGRAIALKLGQAGYSILINYLSRKDAAESTAEEIKKYGVEAHIVQANVSILEEQKKLINECIQHFGQLDVLVNNAGITRDNLLVRMKPEEWKEVIDTNLLSLISLSNLAIEQMRKQGSGKIINISSVVGVHGNAGQANYSTVKAGVISLTKIKARELMPNIQINCIAPGLVATDMTAGFELDKLSTTKLGRAANPEDIASCVEYLVNSGSYVTGQVIEVDGGLSLWSDAKALAL